MTRDQVLRYLPQPDAREGVTAEAVSHATGTPLTTVVSALNSARRAGNLIRSAQTGDGSPRTYRLTPQGQARANRVSGRSVPEQAAAILHDVASSLDDPTPLRAIANLILDPTPASAALAAAAVTASSGTGQPI